jgi:hypothetical protein
MLKAYRSIPHEPLDKYGHWPLPLALVNAHCCECGAEYTTWHTSSGERGSGVVPFSDIPDYPHLAYTCGGGWRQVYDHWEGFCGVPKTRQLEIEFTV